MKIVFVCQHNIFRSQTAEWYFNQINKTDNTCTSGGIFPGIQIPKEVIELVELEGVKIEGTPKGITTKILRNTDLIILIASEINEEIVSKDILKGQVECWNISDYPKRDRHDIITEIKHRVEDLVNRLK